MVAVSAGFKEAAVYGSLKTRLEITVYNTDGSTVDQVISNKQIVSESMTLSQGICDDTELRFGGCIASLFEIDVSSNIAITGKRIRVQAYQTATMPLYPGTNVYPGATIYPGGAAYTVVFPIFTGVVDSCALSKNRLTRHLVAYDDFYKLLGENCADWYKSLFSSTVTLGSLRTAILTRYGITQADSGASLPADPFVLHKMDVDEITAAELLRMIGEFSAVFMRLDGAGELRYISISADRLATPEEYRFYKDAEAEDYDVSGFDCIETRSLGTYDLIDDSPQDVPYILDNPLVTSGYVASATQTGDQFQTAWDAVEGDVSSNYQIECTPFTFKAQSRLWVELGDPITFDIRWYALTINGTTETTVTNTDTVESVVLSRRIKGIQAMTDEFRALQN